MVDRSRRHDADVRELIERDAGAGIRTLLVDAANALPAELPGTGLRFGVWDGEIVTDAAGGTSRREEDVRERVTAADALRTARDDPRELILDEPLARLARMARAVAPRRCDGGRDGGVDCTAYHGLIQYLRLVGIAASPQRHGHFYRRALAAAAPAGRPARVLIAGAADASMLIHVLAAFEGAGGEVDVTVVDRCSTPLEICRAYAATGGAEVRAVRSDVTRFEADTPYDVICTESLLTLLPPDVRAAAVARWRALLRPLGRVVTTARVASGPGAGPGLDPAAAGVFAAGVRREAERRRELLDVDPEVLAAEASRYHGTIPLHPLGSYDELAELFAGAGFAAGIDRVHLDGRAPATGNSIGSYRSADYARVVAVRE